MAKHSWEKIIDQLADSTTGMVFSAPVSHVYHPLTYARTSHLRYCDTYGRPGKEVILLGMNPGPWGMAQTGIPFGDRQMVKEWLGVQTRIGQPEQTHPKRPVLGFQCRRSEVSGQRLWGWARDRFKTPQVFFDRFWVANYCPLAFMEASGRNRTPDKLPRHEKEILFAACDKALVQTVERLNPRYVIGVGRFAARQAEKVLYDADVNLGCITHPSPANPKANRGWAQVIEKELADLGIKV
jgi:single-strand selective monofunctional uracil DNA glycosylase